MDLLHAGCHVGHAGGRISLKRSVTEAEKEKLRAYGAIA